jgi:hypothetical protein
MSNTFAAGKWRKEDAPLPAPKRISTPAGMRLSVVMNESTIQNIASPISPNQEKKEYLPQIPSYPYLSSPTVRVVEESDEDAESIHKQPDSAKSAILPLPYAESVYSQPSLPSIFAKDDPKERKPGRLTTLAILDRRRLPKWAFLAIVLAILILGVVIGLAVGLSKKHTQ